MQAHTLQIFYKKTRADSEARGGRVGAGSWDTRGLNAVTLFGIPLHELGCQVAALCGVGRATLLRSQELPQMSPPLGGSLVLPGHAAHYSDIFSNVKFKIGHPAIGLVSCGVVTVY